MASFRSIVLVLTGNFRIELYFAVFVFGGGGGGGDGNGGFCFCGVGGDEDEDGVKEGGIFLFDPPEIGSDMLRSCELWLVKVRANLGLG